MFGMFEVRSARALAPSLESGLPSECRLRAASAPHARTPHLAPYRMCPPFATRQNAVAFNQPLSLDTSSVTDMRQMFQVRSARALAYRLQSGLPSECRLRAPPPPHTPARRTSPRASYALLSIRQGASAFNQPLSFVTSKVTHMNNMFEVRSARALALSLESGPPPVHSARALPPTHALSPPGPYLAPHRTPSFRLGSGRRRSTSR